MKEDLVLTITMLIFLIIVMFGIQISKRIKIRRFQKEKICRQFGKIPDMDSTLPMDRIKVYYEQMEEGDVDQVTWSDLLSIAPDPAFRKYCRRSVEGSDFASGRDTCNCKYCSLHFVQNEV